MPVNPNDIIERQLQILFDQSQKGPLTESEAMIFQHMVKLQLVLRFKTPKSDDTDEMNSLSSEDLKSLLPLLRND